MKNGKRSACTSRIDVAPGKTAASSKRWLGGVGWLSVAIVLDGCGGGAAKAEAANLVRLVTELREAPNQLKRGPLDRLAAMPCTAKDVCEARDACSDAYRHHVRGIELGARIRGALDGPDAASAGPEELGFRLLEMNAEIEAAKDRMPNCDDRVMALRLAQKV